MARYAVNQTNFTAGELSPRMKGRTDVARYQNGAETIENGIVVVHGGIVRRDGQRFLAVAKLGGAKVARLIGYVTSITQSFVLEFGENYVRVFEGATGATILNDALATLEIASPYTADQLAEITFTQDADLLMLFHPDVPTQQLRRITPTLWTLMPMPWTVVPFDEIGHSPDAKLTLSAATVGAGRTFSTSATTVPGAPTIGTATPFKASARVTFTPAGSGGSGVIDYTVTSSPGGITATGKASPITVNGLTNGVAYTFTVKARNVVGSSAASAASNSVTPLASLPGATITVSASTLNFSASVGNSLQEVDGPSVTPTSGTGPYTYAWTKLSGSAKIGITRANTSEVELSSAGNNTTNYASLRCTVTDANGSIGSVDINVTIVHHKTSSGGGVPV